MRAGMRRFGLAPIRADRTVLVNDPTISGRFDRMHVEIAVELADGAAVARRCDAPLGSWSRPVPAAQVAAKAHVLLADVLGPAATAAIEDILSSAGGFEVRRLMALL